MLILSRKEGEALIINKNIRIVYLERRWDGQIRLGIDAPEHVCVDREEIHEKREQKRSKNAKHDQG